MRGEDLMNCPNPCTDPHLRLLDQETNCFITRSVYARTGWTFNVIWVWPCYTRGQGSYILWGEHPSHLTFCIDLCRECKLLGRWQFICKGAMNGNTQTQAGRHVMWTHTCTHSFQFHPTLPPSHTRLKRFLFQAVIAGFKHYLWMGTTIKACSLLC